MPLIFAVSGCTETNCFFLPTLLLLLHCAQLEEDVLQGIAFLPSVSYGLALVAKGGRSLGYFSLNTSLALFLLFVFRNLAFIGDI